MLSNTVNLKEVLNLEYGRCLMDQREKLDKLMQEYSVEFQHSEACNIKSIYENKTIEEVEKIHEDFKSNKREVRLATVGLLIDKNVSFLLINLEQHFIDKEA
jgi:hypothetical protein